MLAVLLIFGMTGCGLFESDEKKCRKSLSSCLDAFKAADYESAFSYIYGATSDLFDAKQLNAALLTSLCSGVSYTIDSVTLAEDKQSAAAAISFTNTDAKSVLDSAYAKIVELSMNADFLALDEDKQTAEIEKVFSDTLSENGEKKVTLAVEVPMSKSEKIWQVKTDAAGLNSLLNAALGGFYDAASSLGLI